MADPLEDLIRELKRERSPQSVQERVARRLGLAAGSASGTPGPRAWARLFAGPRPALAMALVLVLAVAAAVFGPGIRRPTAPRHAAVQEAAEPARVAAQAQGALVAIGRILLETGVRAEDALVTEALPPLVDSFHSTTTRIIQSL